MNVSINHLAVQQSLSPAIVEFCARWKIAELALFGSILGPSFRDSSDVDILVTFSDDAKWGLLDHVAMETELQEILGRDVDLVSKRAVQESANRLRRDEILESAFVIYTSSEVSHGP